MDENFRKLNAVAVVFFCCCSDPTKSSPPINSGERMRAEAIARSGPMQTVARSESTIDVEVLGRRRALAEIDEFLELMIQGTDQDRGQYVLYGVDLSRRLSKYPFNRKDRPWIIEANGRMQKALDDFSGLVDSTAILRADDPEHYLDFESVFRESAVLLMREVKRHAERFVDLDASKSALPGWR